jgi:anti-sigma regulatory factor (Ser/Thr protein kinase)
MMGGDDALVSRLVELGNAGCQGNSKDFESWLKYVCKVEASAVRIESALASLVEVGAFRAHPDVPGEFLAAQAPRFGASIQYEVSGVLTDAPIQMVRSRLEAFLRFHGASESDIIDLSIATTEAIENAVKYSDHTVILVEYEISAGEFRIRIVNPIKEAAPEQDIEAGKYSSATTLMRGMMVMVKLFDAVDLDISEERRRVTFSATRKLRTR